MGYRPGYSYEKMNQMKLTAIQIKKLNELISFSDRYEINIQFWPKQISVYIAKDGVDLIDYGCDFDFAIDNSIEYLKRLNP